MSFVETRAFTYILAALACAAWASPGLALAPGSAANPLGESPGSTSRLGPALVQALRAPVPPHGLAVGVTLRGDDLPAPGPERGRRVRERQQRVLETLPAGGFLLKRRFRTLSGMAGWIQPSALATLAAHPEVAFVYLDGRVRASLAQGVALVGADVAHASGYTGEGVSVAVLDTGIDSDHPDFTTGSDLVAQHCFCDDHPSPVRGCCPGRTQESESAEDDEGHGTSVAGVITSDGAVGGLGVAPDAGIVAVKVLDAQGGGSFTDVAAGLDWVLAHREEFSIRVVNLSLGDTGAYADPGVSPCSGTNTANAIALLHAAGVAVFAASGNEAHTAGISFPACVSEAISVVAVSLNNLGGVSWCADASCSSILCTDASTAPDVFTCHSNSHALLDLLAPDWRTDVAALGGGIAAFGGTSASSPYAAAQASLLFQADPGLSADAVRTLLTQSGPSVPHPSSGLSFPRADVAQALDALLGVCGDAVVDPGEDCDDGNALDGDCCSGACLFEASGSVCGTGDACVPAPSCDGAGLCVPGEPLVCDDGDPLSTDHCDPVEGCVFTFPPAPVPALGGLGRAVLALLVLAAGFVGVARRGS
jgi:cysteine-rich repeat protein